MSLATDVWNELKKLREHKAFYAAAGAGDAAMEALRGLPERLGRLQSKADLAALSGRAVEYVIVFGARAVQTYDELAERGREVVGTAEPHQATELEPRPPGTVSVAGSETAVTVRESVGPPSQGGPAAGRPGSAAGQPGSAAGTGRTGAGQPEAAAGRAGSAGSAPPRPRTSQPGSARSAGPAARRTGSATSQGTAKPGRPRGKSTD